MLSVYQCEIIKLFLVSSSSENLFTSPRNPMNFNPVCMCITKYYYTQICKVEWRYVPIIQQCTQNCVTMARIGKIAFFPSS